MNTSVWDAIYLRKSRADDPHESLEETLRKHKKILEKLVKDKGYHVKDIYEEVVSGESLFARPQMLKLLEAVKAGKYAHVICVDIQRLGRGSMLEQGIILDAFKTSGTIIVTPYREYDLANETDETYTEFETFMSRQEYKMIRKRLTRGLKATIEAGGYVANAPYGYERCMVGKLPSLKIVEEEAKFVRQIFDLYLSGVGCQRIADSLNAQGARPRRRAEFTRNSIRCILQNPVYTGKIVWDKKTHVRPGKKGNTKHLTIYNPRDKWTVLQGLHPAIVTEEEFSTVQDMFEKRMKVGGYTGKTVNPLAGLVICGNCGQHMQRAAHMRGGPFLLCLKRGCIPMSKLSLVEDALISSLREQIKDLQYKAESTPENKTDPSEQERKAVKKQITITKSQDDKLHDLLEQGVYDTETFLRRHEELTKRIKSLEATLNAIQPPVKIDISKTIQKVQSVLDLYQDADPEEKNHLLKSIVQKVVYHKGKGAKPDGFTLEVFLLPFYL